ncbi:MAG TPA: hypothetical protein VF439_00895 [Candidatus Paceibacterota bacterium]
MKGSPVYVLLLIIGALLVVVAYRYEEYVQLRNFTLVVNGPCDPAAHDCFVSDCSTDDDPSCDTTPYDKIEITDNQAPACLEEHACTEFSCPADSDSCSITYCSADALEDGETCSAEPSDNTQL